jgi:hypothetical protein
MAGIILPKTHIEHLDKPLIFLAGPIRSAPEWHDEAIDMIFSREQDIIIASPQRHVKNTLEKYILINNTLSDYFPRQRAWERHYLDIASRTGAILFWLPGEARHDCKKIYGAMTRIELGQWMTNYRHNNSLRICIGSDGTFPELDTIKYDLSLDAPDIPIKESLEETCLEAIQLVRQG